MRKEKWKERLRASWEISGMAGVGGGGGREVGENRKKICLVNSIMKKYFLVMCSESEKEGWKEKITRNKNNGGKESFELEWEIVCVCAFVGSTCTHTHTHTCIYLRTWTLPFFFHNQFFYP